jgi:hypothetical protein
MWAILTNGRSFFNMVLVEAQFCRGERFKWPPSLIHKITDGVRFAKPINQPFYLAEWLIATTNRQGTVGNNGGGGNTGEGTIKGQTMNQTRDDNPRGGATVVEEGIADNLGLMTATCALLP